MEKILTIAEVSQRILAVYKEYEDISSIEYVNGLIAQKKELASIERFRSDPHVRALLKDAQDRVVRYYEKILSDKDMSQEERKMLFVAIDWGLWYIHGIGGDLKEVSAEIDKVILNLARILKVE